MSTSPPTGHTAQLTLKALHYACPIILLVFFLAAFTTRSILVAKSTNTVTGGTPSTQTGPGGKPLPKKVNRTQDKNLAGALDFSRSRKLLFNWLSVAAATSFVANAATVIVHALVNRHEGWWSTLR